MTKLLEKAFAEALKLPEHEQDALAAVILEELVSERHWDQAFAASADLLAQLADQALAEHRARKTSWLIEASLPPVVREATVSLQADGLQQYPYEHACIARAGRVQYLSSVLC